MRTARLEQLCDINPRAPKDLDDAATAAFLPMAAVSEDGAIAYSEARPVAEVKKGYTYFERGDVLVAKITPCFENGKATRTSQLEHPFGFGSTEFHVLRPSSELCPDYLFHMVWNPFFRATGTRNMTGSAGQKRVPADFLKRYEIPLPPLPEQRQIAAILDKADALRRKRRQALDLLDSLTQSIFLEMFGAQDWPRKPIDDLCVLVRGSSPRPQGDPRYFGGPVPRLMIGDITRDGKYVKPRIDSLTAEGAKKSRPMAQGSVVMAVSGAVGLPAILDVDACIHDGFVGFRELSREISADFLYEFLLLERYRSSAMSTGAIWVNLTTDQVKRMEIPIPPCELQEKFREKAIELQKPRGLSRDMFVLADSLFASLQSRAFSGQL